MTFFEDSAQASVPPVHMRHTWYSIVWTCRRIRFGVPVCIPNPIYPLVTAVICAALHPVRFASCTSKIFLSFYWTCFSFGCAQRIRKKLVQLRRHCPQSQCKYRATFSISTSSKSRPETSSPRFNSTCHFLARGDTAHSKHPEASQETEMVEFLPRLQLQRWAAEARDVRVDFFSFFFFLKKSRFAVFLTAHASPAHS